MQGYLVIQADVDKKKSGMGPSGFTERFNMETETFLNGQLRL